jgi:hypothetical protein
MYDRMQKAFEAFIDKEHYMSDKYTKDPTSSNFSESPYA